MPWPECYAVLKSLSDKLVHCLLMLPHSGAQDTCGIQLDSFLECNMNDPHVPRLKDVCCPLLWASCSSKAPQERPIKLFTESQGLSGLQLRTPPHSSPKPLSLRSALAQQPRILVLVFSLNYFSSYSHQMPDKGNLKLAGNVQSSERRMAAPASRVRERCRQQAVSSSLGNLPMGRYH